MQRDNQSPANLGVSVLQHVGEIVKQLSVFSNQLSGLQDVKW